MYNLRDEAQKRGVNIGWDPQTKNVNVGQHNLTPQQLTGMGGQNNQGSWQLPQQALNNLLGGGTQQPTNAPVQDPMQYQPFQRQEFQAERPDYDQYFGRALSEAMANREPLARKAVNSVDENMAARGLYRSGVRESAATGAVAELEVALRNLAQQQATQQYGMSLGQYNQDRQSHYANQDADANQHQFGQIWNRDNVHRTQDIDYRTGRDAIGDQRWAEEFGLDQAGHALRERESAANDAFRTRELSIKERMAAAEEEAAKFANPDRMLDELYNLPIMRIGEPSKAEFVNKEYEASMVEIERRLGAQLISPAQASFLSTQVRDQRDRVTRPETGRNTGEPTPHISASEALSQIGIKNPYTGLDPRFLFGP